MEPASSVEKTVLLAIDEPDVRRSLALLLRLSGFRVVEATNGLGALTYLRTESIPALVILDLLRPGVDDVQFRQAQRAKPRLAGIPVLLCTTQEHADREPAFQGVAAILLKPVDPVRLLSLVREYTHSPGPATPRPVAEGPR